MSQRAYARPSAPASSASANPYSGVPGGVGAGSNHGGYADAQEHEQANDAMVDTLRSKVSFLRDVSIKIGQETRDSLAQMDEMNLGYEKQHDLMKRTKNRLLAAANAQSWGWFHLLLFIIIVFAIFFLTYVFK